MSETDAVNTPRTSTQSSPRYEASLNVRKESPQFAGGEKITTITSISRSNFWRRHGEGDEPDVLQPDHPLMKRFQESLKLHLERQNDRLCDEVFELETDIKKKQQQCDHVGVTLYDLQQNLTKKQKLIDEYHETLSKISKMRQEMETQMETSKNLYKSEQDKLNNAQKREVELRTELDGLMNLEHQFKEWEKEMESDLLVSERISEKTKIEKAQLTEKMHKQDLFILRLLNEIASLEARLIILDGQFKMKESEKNKINQAVADANADLEALSKEQHRLVQSWNSVIINMQQRDKVYSKITKDFNDVQEEFQTLNYDVEGLKKSSEEEMLKNERLTMVLNKLGNEKSNIERLTVIEEEKKGTLETQLSTVHGMLEQTDKEIDQIMLVLTKNSQEDMILRKEVEKLSNEKVNLEDKILEKLQDQITQDKAAKYLNKVLHTLRDKSRSQEISMVNTENQLMQVSLEVECQKGINEQIRINLEEKKKQMHTYEKTLQDYEAQLFQCKSKVSKKQGEIDTLNRKLEQLLEKCESVTLSPQEIKIVHLEKTIEDTTVKVDELQQFWMRKQAYIVQIANQRNKQLNDMNLIRKQMLIMTQRSLKLEFEIELQKKEEQRLIRATEFLHCKLQNFNSKIAERKDYKETLDKDNLYTQNQYVNILKSAELEAVTLQSEINDLIQEKNQLKEAMMDTQREYLAWEKKLQMAQETKQNIDYEKGKEGEMGSMKSEIHRMEVRYSQLRKAQEKLIGDLEQCVSRRDVIVTQAEARERKTYKSNQYNLQRKLEETRSKIKNLNSEIKTVEQEIGDIQGRKIQLLNQMKTKQDKVQQLHDSIKEINTQLEEGQLQRQKNLEVLVRRQRKSRMYGDIKTGRYRSLFRNEQSLEAELQRQKCMNSDLTCIVESLLNDFPMLKFPFTKIINTLRLKPA